MLVFEFSKRLDDILVPFKNCIIFDTRNIFTTLVITVYTTQKYLRTIYYKLCKKLCILLEIEVLVAMATSTA